MNGVRIAVPAAAGAYFRIALQSYDKSPAPPNSAARFRPVFNINSAVFQQRPVYPPLQDRTPNEQLNSLRKKTEIIV